jgi:hypothetical protein
MNSDSPGVDGGRPCCLGLGSHHVAPVEAPDAFVRMGVGL